MRLNRAPSRGVVATALLAGCCCAVAAGCSASKSPAMPTVSAVRVLPFRVAGPVEQPEFVGGAIAEALIRELEPLADLRVGDASAALGPGTATLDGDYHRGENESCLEVRATIEGRDEPLWSVVRCSESQTVVDLVYEVARGCMNELGRTPPASYPYISRVEGSPEMNASPLLANARDLFNRGDYPRSAAEAARLVERFPDEAAAHVVLAWALTLVWDVTPTEENLSALRDELDQLKQLDPNTPYDNVIQAFVYRSSGAPDEARQLFSRVIERADLTPAARSWVLRLRSYTYVQIGQVEAARRDGEDSVRLDPVRAQSRIALSRAAEAANDVDDALARATEAVALEPNSWRLLQRVGIVAMRAGLADQAADYLGRACDLSDNQESCANLGVALQRAGKTDDALRVATKATGLAPTRWGAYNLACLWSRRGDRERALASLRRASELGFADVLIRDDSDLKSLRELPAFQSVVETVMGRIRSRRNIATTVFPWQG